MDDFSFQMLVVNISFIVQDVLDERNIDEKKSLIELGADSLDIIEILTKIDKLYGIELEKYDEIQYFNPDTTIEDLARIVKSKI